MVAEEASAVKRRKVVVDGIVIILACLEKNPDRRPTMEQVARVYADSASLFK
jgi:hypothetical protein